MKRTVVRTEHARTGVHHRRNDAGFPSAASWNAADRLATTSAALA
ncbi:MULTISPECIES: hypothetical protein [unclassified Streptomyces]|nr:MULTISPECIES: hypothetical protein [unclassified Streptomyces]